MRRILALLALSLAGAASAAAQPSTGTIVGSVRDSSGAAVAGASVVALRAETRVKRHSATGSAGDFTVAGLPLGTYTLTVQHPGFRTARREGIRLDVDEKARVDFTLEVGPLEQTLTVTGDAPMAQAGSSALGTVVDSSYVRELPLNGRDFLQLALLLPGSAPPAPGSELSTQSASGLHFNGARESANNFLLDGIDDNDWFINRIVISPSLELVEEFKVQAAAYAAEFGRSGGGQVLVVTRGGSNRWRASAYEYLRNAAFDARNLFDPPDQPIPQLQRNQFGVFAGGPLRRDRAFVSGNYEGTRLRQAVTRTARVPTAAEKAGDFSASAVPLVDPLTRVAFPGNRLPAGRIDRIGAAVARLFPDPNRADPQANFVSSPVGRANLDQATGRVDLELSRHDSLVARYTFGREDTLEAFNEGITNLPGYGSLIVGRGQHAAISETHVFGPGLVNELRVGFNRLRREVLQENVGNDLATALGIPGLSREAVDAGTPSIVVSGFDRLADNTALPIVRHDTTYHASDAAAWVHGSHTVKAGGEVRRFQVNGFNHVFARGQFTFQPTYTGYALGDLLLGLPTVAIRGANDNPQALRATAYNLFAQDDWKVRPDLTVNLGLRWELNRPPVDKHDRMAIFDLAGLRVVQVGQGGFSRSGLEADTQNFAPRVGLSWNPRWDRRSTVRAAYGIFYDAGTLVANSALYFNPPYFELSIFVPSQTRFLTLADPFPTGAGFKPAPTVTTLAPDFPSAYVGQWHLTLEREVGANLLARVGYVGSRGTRLIRQRNLNQPAPGAGVVNNRRPLRGFADVSLIEPTANSAYHSLQASLERRLAAGVQLLAAYTFSRSLDDTSDFLATSADENYPQDSSRLYLERGLSNFDLRHRFTLASIVDLPFGAGRRFGPRGGLANRLAGGWQAGVIATAQSGFPFTPRLGRDNSNTGNVGGILGFDRPNRIGRGTLEHPTADRFFDTAAFPVPPQYTFGNSGRNVLTGPGLATLDVSLRKAFPFAGERRIELRVEAFNLFNHPPLALPERVADQGATFGKVLSAGPARQLQFALKLYY